jgi:hypothetical protein
VKFREKDFWQELSGEFEVAVGSLRRQIYEEQCGAKAGDNDATHRMNPTTTPPDHSVAIPTGSDSAAP